MTAKRLTKAGVHKGAFTVVRLDTGASVSLPWPPPKIPEGAYGAWLPAVLGRHPDGTATGVWKWHDAPLGRPGRADVPPEEGAA